MKTVLVVDDEQSLARLVHDILCDEGYAVMTAHNGVEALACLHTVKPDLVLSDYMMPGLDGHELALAMQADPELAPIPFVLMSAARAPSSAEPCAAFLRKPFDLDELVALVQRCLEGKDILVSGA